MPPLTLDLLRTLALTALAYMIGDLIGALVHETCELWGLAIGGLALVVGTSWAMHRDEMRAWGLPTY